MDHQPLTLEEQERLSALVDGELQGTERAEAEALVARSAAAQALVAELQSLSSQLRDLPRHELATDLVRGLLATPEHVSDLARVAPRQSWRPSPRSIGWAVMATAAAVIVAVLVPPEPQPPATDLALRDRAKESSTSPAELPELRSSDKIESFAAEAPVADPPLAGTRNEDEALGRESIENRHLRFRGGGIGGSVESATPASPVLAEAAPADVPRPAAMPASESPPSPASGEARFAYSDATASNWYLVSVDVPAPERANRRFVEVLRANDFVLEPQLDSLAAVPNVGRGIDSSDAVKVEADAPGFGKTAVANVPAETPRVDSFEPSDAVLVEAEGVVVQQVLAALESDTANFRNVGVQQLERASSLPAESLHDAPALAAADSTDGAIGDEAGHVAEEPAAGGRAAANTALSEPALRDRYANADAYHEFFSQMPAPNVELNRSQLSNANRALQVVNRGQLVDPKQSNNYRQLLDETRDLRRAMMLGQQVQLRALPTIQPPANVAENATATAPQQNLYSRSNVVRVGKEPVRVLFLFQPADEAILAGEVAAEATPAAEAVTEPAAPAGAPAEPNQ